MASNMPAEAHGRVMHVTLQIDDQVLQGADAAASSKCKATQNPAGWVNWPCGFWRAMPGFVFGVYRRHMKVIGYLGRLDRLFGVPITTRSWNTITAIAKVLV